MEIDQEIRNLIDRMVVDRNLRRAITTESPRFFFGAYLSHYVKSPFAYFHFELFDLMADPTKKTIVVMGARNSAKSAIMNTGLALWSVLGKPQKKFVVLLGATQAKSKLHFLELRREFEQNKLLRSDLGPFRTEESQWGDSIILPKYDAQITFASTEQSIRGMRYKDHRPDLIIGDDLEHGESVRTIDARNKMYNWFTEDVLPAGDSETTRVVILGTMLHEDSLMMRLKKEIRSGARTGTYREYPFLDEFGQALWRERYPDREAVETLRRYIGNERAWAQEFLLKIIPPDDQVIRLEWIRTYRDHPPRDRAHDYRGTFISIDPASSQSDTACKTAMVIGRVFGWGEDMKIYFLPNPINDKMDINDALEKAKALSRFYGDGGLATIYIEDNGAQRWMVDLLLKERYPAVGVHAAINKYSAA